MYQRRLIDFGRIICAFAFCMSVVLVSHPQRASAQPTPQTIFGVTTSNLLVQFSSTAPGRIAVQHPISGLTAGDQILGIDFRPANGDLVALSSSNRLYTVNPNTAAATLIGTQPFTSTNTGSAFGFDFNPSVDRIRLVSDTRVNLRLNPITGGVAAVDGQVAYAPADINAGDIPRPLGAAYTNNISGTATTQLYVIDTDNDVLALQGTAGPPAVSPNTGQLFTVGALGVDAGDLTGFDIAPNGAAFVSITSPVTTTTEFGAIDLTTGAVTVVGRVGGGEALRDIAVATRALPLPPAATVYAVTSSNTLLQFRSTTPGTIDSSRPVTGLPSGEQLVGIDFRPANGQLFGLGSTNQLYRLDPATGAATIVGTQPFTTTAIGTAFGFDFNPSVDRIRLVSDTRVNLRLNPITGGVAAVDGQISYAGGDTNAGDVPRAVAAGYTNNISGTTTTQLYVIDAENDVLALQGTVGPPAVSPNTGLLFTIGALGTDVGDLTGFDITPRGAAYVSTTAPGGTSSSFGTIDLATGTITSIGAIGGNETIRDIALGAGPGEDSPYKTFLPVVIRP